ncbi:hypothetical protein JTE90_020567 [Oedothorax gibbosus]|uniref:Uncharacterized protein n=1 Tax=Oedothorax gibbosus TaxID=931172 RepID=A0AAV6VYL9_9ARAC|nr:hypothetical protein JTE90_020567 [Oedothorax gibbosus]
MTKKSYSFKTNALTSQPRSLVTYSCSHHKFTPTNIENATSSNLFRVIQEPEKENTGQQKRLIVFWKFSCLNFRTPGVTTPYKKREETPIRFYLLVSVSLYLKEKDFLTIGNIAEPKLPPKPDLTIDVISPPIGILPQALL